MTAPMAGPPPSPRDPDGVRRLADEILAGREFAPAERSWFQRALDWVLRQLERLLGDGGDPSGTGGDAATGGSSGFTILVLVLAAAAVVAIAFALRGTWRRRRPAGPSEPDVDLEERRSAEAWDAAAIRLEAEGRWKDALRARFGALVERLADGGVVADVPGRTTGEYRSDIRSALPEAADAFAAAADLFDRAWYGDLPTGPAEQERFVADADRVLTAAGSRP